MLTVKKGIIEIDETSELLEKTSGQVDPIKIKTLVSTALGKAKADLVITNANLVNVYSGELLKGQSVAVKGDRINRCEAGGIGRPDSFIVTTRICLISSPGLAVFLKGFNYLPQPA